MEEILKKVNELGENFENKLKAANEAATKENKEALKQAIEDVNKASQELFGKNKQAYEALEGKMKLIAEDLERSKKQTIEPKGTSFKESLKKSLIDNELIEEYVAENGETLMRLKNADRLSGKIQLKAAIDMTTALTMVPGTDTNIGYLTSYSMKKVELPISQDIHMTQVVPVKRIATKYFGVVVYHTETKGAATAAENVAGGKSSFKVKTIEYKVHDVTCYFHIAKNNLEDIDMLLNDIEKRAQNNINEVIDAKTLGTNATDATDVQGLLGAGNYTAFSETGLGTVKMANIVDLIRKVRLQARKAGKKVNAVIMNSTDIDEIETLKDANGNYPNQLGVKFDANGKIISVGGLAIIENDNITANQLLAINTEESSEIGIRKDVEMEIGWENDDLTKRMVTIVFVTRLAHGIKDAASTIYVADIDSAVSNITAA